MLAWAASAYDLPLLLHVSEPTGHAYGGKQGLSVDALWRFAAAASGVTIIAAHWGGGLPFYTLMPEVRDALANTYFDTSAEHLLYDAAVYRRAIDLVGAERILWGSDFPLIRQAKALERPRAAGLSDAELTAILGGNAAELFGPVASARMLRLFVAVELPAEVRADPNGRWTELPRWGIDKRLRWVRPEGVHVTLKFLGTTPEEAGAGAIEWRCEGARRCTPVRRAAVTVGSFGGRRGLRGGVGGARWRCDVGRPRLPGG